MHHIAIIHLISLNPSSELTLISSSWLSHWYLIPLFIDFFFLSHFSGIEIIASKCYHASGVITITVMFEVGAVILQRIFIVIRWLLDWIVLERLRSERSWWSYRTESSFFMLLYMLHCANHSANAHSPFVLLLALILTLTLTLPTFIPKFRLSNNLIYASQLLCLFSLLTSHTYLSSTSSTLSTWLFLTGTGRTLCLTLASLTSQARAEGIRSKPTLRERLSGLNCARSPSGRLWVR